MADHDESRVIFDRIADQYERFAGAWIHERVKARVLSALRDALPRGASILDVGCGPGTYAIPLAQRGFRVTAVDISSRMLERLAIDAAAAGVSVETRRIDANDDLSSIAIQDAAISIQGPLSYAADPIPLARNIAGRVRSGGLPVFALARGAALEQIARTPRRALSPFLAREGVRISGELAGAPISVYLHDARRLARRLGEIMEIVERSAVGVSSHLPANIDDRLGRWRGIRSFGASSLFIGRVRH